MLHSSAYLLYGAWIGPFLLPFLLAYLWRDRIQRRAAFVFIGVLCAFGVVFISTFFLGFLLAGLNSILGLSLRGSAYGVDSVRAWFNGIFMLAFNLAISFLALKVLSRVLTGHGPKVPVRTDTPSSEG